MAEGKPIGSIKLGVSLDGTEFGNTLDDLTRQLKVAESSMKTNLKAFDGAQKSVDALAQKQKDLTTVSEGYDKKVQVLTKRLNDQESAENRNEKAIANTKKQLNDAIAKQNGYAQQLDKTKQELIYAENGVNDLSQALKDNTKSVNDEVKALKDAGDKTGAFEAKQKGLTKQSDLLKQSIKAQENVVSQMAQEFGQSSTQVEKAEKSLQSLKNQSGITEKQLDSLKNSTDDVSESFELGAQASGVMQGSLLADFVTTGLEKVKDIVGGIIENLNEASEQYNLLKAQLGSDVDVSALQNSIQAVFKQGFGDSLEEVQEGMVAIKQMLPELNGKELEGMTANALAFSKATGSDVNESIRGAKSLMTEYGLSSEQAFNLMNKGAQNGLNYSGELADNLAEYAQIFKQNGYSSEEMFAILDNGTKTGAYNLDKVNDFAKEFGISLSDGRIEENIGKFSTGTQELFSQFKEGKATAGDMLKAVTGDMASMTSQTEKAGLASTLWSALGEDNSLKMIEALGNTNDAYKNVEGTASEVNNAIKNSEPFEALKRNIQGSFTPFSEKISGLKSQVTDLINNTFEKFPTVSSLGLGTLATGVGVLGGAFLIALIPAGVFSAIMTAIGTAIGVITSPITLAIAGIALLVGAFILAYQQIKPFKDFIDELMVKIKEFADKIYNEYIKPAFDEVVRAFTELGNAIRTWWNQNGAQFLQALQNFLSMIWAYLQPALQLWSGIFGATFRTIVDLVKIGWDTIKGLFSGAFTVIKGLLDIFIGIFTGDWSRAWDGVKSVAEGAWKMITSGFSGFVDGIKRLASGIGDAISSGIGGAVNGVIDAINWVLDKLGSPKIAHVKWGSDKKYASGTEGHTGGNAIVNDGRGAELVQLPNGNSFIPEGRNVFIPQMPVGTRVFTAEQTASMFGKKSPTFRYKNGIGNFIGDVWQSTKSIAGQAWNGVKGFAGDIFDFMQDPVGLLKNVFADFANFTDLFDPWLGMAQGGVSYIIDSSKNYLTKIFEEMFADSSNVDTSVGAYGVMNYLNDIANKAMARFKGMSVTSGYREGDPHSHGKRQAIDLAYPASMNGSSKYFEPANWIFEKFASKVAYVITQGQVRDRSAMSGSGSSGKWLPWGDNDHYDHLHVNGLIGLGQGGNGRKGDNSSGVERWRAIATQALKMEGQYSTANLNALLNQMRTESNGNPSAINNWDINAKNGVPSQGLMQVIPPTFRAYARKGFNTNITDPLSNILASIRYTLARYGSLTRGWRGVGYSNGGFITKEHMAMVGEGNKPEVVIPLDKAKRSRAMQLLAKTKNLLGDNDGLLLNSVSTTDNSGVESKLDTLIQLMSQLLSKDSNTYLDGKKVSKQLDSIKQDANTINAKRLGLA